MLVSGTKWWDRKERTKIKKIEFALSSGIRVTPVGREGSSQIFKSVGFYCHSSHFRIASGIERERTEGERKKESKGFPHYL